MCKVQIKNFACKKQVKHAIIQKHAVKIVENETFQVVQGMTKSKED